MSAEVPALSAVVARLHNPEINLAAFGGITYPLALIIESPIIMLLAASTALSKDWPSFVRLRRYMNAMGLILTVGHLVFVFSPLYDLIARQVLGAPAEIIEPGRLGLIIFIPWTWAIAYRRFHQGMLIRFNRSYTVGTGTLIRLTADTLVLVTGYFLGTFPGIVVASCAVIFGVLCEALYVGLASQSVIQDELKRAPLVTPVLRLDSFVAFYIPLVLTSLLVLLVQPIGSAALGRMPLSLYSLAAWPVVTGFVSLFRSLGVAYNEVVVALLDWPGARRALRNFTFLLAGLSTVGILVAAYKPLAAWWFGDVSDLSPTLVEMALPALWLSIPLPALTVLQNWYQGTLVHARQTRSITEAVAIFLAVASLALAAGAIWSQAAGLYIASTAFTLANIAQTAWLGFRFNKLQRQLESTPA